MEIPQIAALQSMNKAALAVSPAISRLCDALEQFGTQLYKLVWEVYTKAGAPYGKTQKGLNRWLNEQGEGDRAKNIGDTY